MKNKYFYIVNTVTWWRVVMAPVIVVLAFEHAAGLFKWLLALSFLTDAVDGFLARKYRVTSRSGSRIDSLGDDLTILAGLVGMFVFKMNFIREHITILLILAGLWLFQLIAALIRYGKMSSFHTWLAKIAAVLQGVFLLALFFIPAPLVWLFYAAAGATAIDLIEEIVMVLLLKKWRADVKGLYSLLHSRKGATGQG